MELENKQRRLDGDEDNSGLFEDLIFEEILPRLPLDSLTKFKCVSKEWLARIAYDERLVYGSLRHQSRTTELSIILSQSYLPDRNHRMYVLDHRANSVSVSDVSLYMDEFAGYFDGYHVVGSCNGLVCLYLCGGTFHPEPLVMLQNKAEEIVLWNPATGQARNTVVPSLPPSFYVGRARPDYPAHGFGYDECHNDYKVVRIVPTQPTLLNFIVYSRNSGRWRQLDKGLVGYSVFEESSESVLLNGCLYWLILALEFTAGGRISVAKRRCVLSFDLCLEEFEIMGVLNDCALGDPSDSPFPHQLVKWKENCLAYASFPDERPGQRKEFGFQLILDGNGNVVIKQDASTAQDFYWSRDPPLFYRDESGWKFCGVSRDRFFVAERDKRPGGYSKNHVMYDPFCRGYESSVGEEVLTSHGRSDLYSAHDYVPSLVSVYPDKKSMADEKKKMEVRYWVDMFWKSLGFTKSQFGLPMEMTDLILS